MQVVFTKIMYYWALSLWTRDKLNKQSSLRCRTADLSSQSTLTDRPEAQLKCVGCRDLYWKSFSHLFPQGFCPSTTDAPQTLTRLRLQQLSGCLDTFNAKGIERPWECTQTYKCITKSISGIRAEKRWLIDTFTFKFAAFIHRREHEGAGHACAFCKEGQHNRTCALF